MRAISTVILSALGLSGCLGGGGSAGNVGDACAHLCQCRIEAGRVDEADRASCETDCQDDGAGLTSACYSCVEGTSCPTLNSSNPACESVCVGGGGGGGGAPDVNDACEHACDCAVQSGTIAAADEAACVTQCVTNISSGPDACFACVDSASCTELEDSTFCETECNASALALTSRMSHEQLALLSY